MNEPHDIPASTVFQLMQAGVNGVRASGAKQPIFVEGTCEQMLFVQSAMADNLEN